MVRYAFKNIIWPRRNLLLLGLVLIIVNRLSGLVLPGASKYLIDNVIANDMDTWGKLGDGPNPPHYRLYDRKGKLRYAFSPVPEGDQKTPEEIPECLDELLSE